MPWQCPFIYDKFHVMWQYTYFYKHLDTNYTNCRTVLLNEIPHPYTQETDKKSYHNLTVFNH
jgi:hypothetical protein